MRLAVFVYDFPHRKSAEGLYELRTLGIEPALVLGAPRVELSRPRRIWRCTEAHGQHRPPADICRALAWRYEVVPHNESASLLREVKADYGLILGARVLSPAIVAAVAGGIINLHPGLLPHMRGLDTIEWSVIAGLPMAVTAHVVDERIDCGWLIAQHLTPVEADDSPVDVWIRQQCQQRAMIGSALSWVVNGDSCPRLDAGLYHRAATPAQQYHAEYLWRGYCQGYAKIVASYEQGRKP